MRRFLSVLAFIGLLLLSGGGAHASPPTRRAKPTASRRSPASFLAPGPNTIIEQTTTGFFAGTLSGSFEGAARFPGTRRLPSSNERLAIGSAVTVPTLVVGGRTSRMGCRSLQPKALGIRAARLLVADELSEHSLELLLTEIRMHLRGMCAHLPHELLVGLGGKVDRVVPFRAIDGAHTSLSRSRSSPRPPW